MKKKPDNRMANELLASASILEVLPSIQQKGEFAERALQTVLGLTDSVLCLKGYNAPSSAKSACAGCGVKNTVEPHESFECRLSQDKSHKVIQVRTVESFFGYFIIPEASVEKSFLLEDLLINFLTILSISIENLQKNQRIQDFNKKLQAEIAERSQVQQSLTESEERYHSLFTHMEEGLAYCRMLFDAQDRPVDFVCLTVNDAFERLTGFKDMTGKKVTETIPGIKKSNPELFEVFGRVALTGKSDKFETHFKPLDAWFSISVYSTEIGYFVAVFDNINESKRAEEIRKENEERFKILFELAPDAYYLSDLKGKFVDGNKAAEELLGYNRTDLIGKSFLTLKLLSPKQIKKAALLLAKNIIKKSTGPDEFVLNRKDGSQISVEIRTQPVKFHNKTLVLGIARDITERKRAEEKLQESEKKVRNYIEFAPDGVFIVDDTGRYMETNNAVCQIIGYSIEEILNMSIRDLVAEESLEEGSAHFKKVMETGAAESDLWHKHKDGSTRCLTVNAVKLSETRILGFCKDITERKRAEHQARERMKELRAFYSLTEITEREGITLQKLLQEYITILVQGWQYPEIACARIVIGNDEFRTNNFIESAWKQSASIKVNGSVVGSIDVSYLEERQEEYEGPFLKEERQLINAIAERLGRITERMWAEEELMESKALVEAVVENIPLMIFLKEANDLRFVIFNRAGEELLGYDRKALLGKNNLDLFPPEQAAHFMAKDREVLDGETGNLDIPEEPIQTAKKGQRLLHTRKVCIRGAGGTTKYLLGISEDITERKRMEEALQESAVRAQALLCTIPDMLFRMDRQGIYLDYKADIKELYDQSESTLIGKRNRDIVPTEFADLVDLKIRTTLETGMMQTFEYQLPVPGIGVKDYEARMAASGADEVTVIVRDITERKQAEEKLKSLVKDKEMLIREVHHRVKNNFAIVSSLLNIQSREIQDKDVKEMFLQSKDRIKSMSLIHERLYQSQDLTHINFAEYIRTLAADLYRAYETDPERVSLVNEVEDVLLDMDKVFPCGLIVNELISNALKYAFPKSRTGKGQIKVTLHKINDNEVELAVTDNGVGLPEDFDIQKTRSLGLKLVTMLAEGQLGGKLEVGRKEGTDFRVQFKIPH